MPARCVDFGIVLLALLLRAFATPVEREPSLLRLRREAWRDLSPHVFARSYAKQGQPLLLEGASRVGMMEFPEARQAAKWNQEYLGTRAGVQMLRELPRALAPEVSAAFGDSIVLEDSTHSALFVALRPLSPTFPRDGPLAPLRATQLLFAAAPGAGFEQHLHRREDSYNVLLQGPAQLWWFPRESSAEHSSGNSSFRELCKSWNPESGLFGGMIRPSLLVQHPGDAVWIPAGVRHAVCASTSNGSTAAVSAGGRGDYASWTKAMLAARDGSIPLLQRALNVVAMSANVEREVNKVGRGGPEGSSTSAGHLAASRGHALALEWLLKRRANLGALLVAADGSAAASAQPHPHHLAAAHGHVPALAMLASFRANLAARAGPEDGTAARWAARAGHSDVLRWLSDHAGDTIHAAGEL